MEPNLTNNRIVNLFFETENEKKIQENINEILRSQDYSKQVLHSLS